MKNEVLYINRKLRDMSMIEFAKWLGISYNTYQKYEYCNRIPRSKHAKTIMDKLGLKDGLVFFPDINVEEEEENENIKKKICNQMNSMSSRKHYDLYEVSMIARAVRAESLLRKAKKSKINARTYEGKALIDKEAAKIANKLLKKNSISGDDVALYKRCKSIEYEERTGKCSWGIPSAREALGYDPVTGKEINNIGG